MSPVITTSYCTIATAGHVDHGKTSLIKALTGINPDRLKEEQERQMTTDLGFAHLDFEPNKENVKFVLGFIDVPGHGKFLKNMLAGVGGIETALFVVAADEGPMPQTVQHVKILSLLGVRSFIVALTKIDLVGEKEIAAATSKVKELLAQYGVDLLAIYPVSTQTGKGIDELKAGLYEHLNASGITDSATADSAKADSASQQSVNLGANHIPNNQDAETMLQADAQAKLEAEAKLLFAAAIARSLYMPVDRAFTKSGFGLVVTGTLVEGELSTGEHIVVEPGGVKARVRGMESFGKAIDKATAGQRLAVNLAVKDGGVIARGQCIAGSDRTVVHNLIVEVVDLGGLDLVLSPQPIKLYHGTAEAKGTLRWLENVQAGAAATKQFGQIFLEEPIVAQPGNRYVIRYGDDGIAGGAILLVDRPRWLTRQLVHDISAALIEATAESEKRAFVLAVAAHPLKAVKLSQMTWFMPLENLKEASVSALADGSLVSIADLLMAVSTREQIGLKILALLQTLMANEDNSRFGVSIETMRKKTFNTLTRPVMQAIVADLAQKGLLAREGDRIFTISGYDVYENGDPSIADGGLSEDIANSVPILNAAGRAMAAAYSSLVTPASVNDEILDDEARAGSASAAAAATEGSATSSAAAKPAASAPADPQFAQTNRLRDQIMALLNQHPCLEIEEVARQVKLDVKKLNLTLDGMVKNKQVVIVDHDFVATAGKIRAAHLVLHKLWTTKKDISPSDFREGISTTRKYAMALLSHFDEKGVT
ncbi:MAG: Selenocysteine-specific elongation factor, partial [Cyanobacteriota bacterium erpe_2018_sw_21hr_WHONDRS-SW48-000092_B_bin.40]|nr:Selenocysteine-specific elongation factor [Cyanobacteriota bacterium erpe_2018_sw_21hr_WHONDRS-SW48-000092_B_bin.40]